MNTNTLKLEKEALVVVFIHFDYVTKLILSLPDRVTQNSTSACYNGYYSHQHGELVTKKLTENYYFQSCRPPV